MIRLLSAKCQLTSWNLPISLSFASRPASVANDLLPDSKLTRASLFPFRPTWPSTLDPEDPNRVEPPEGERAIAGLAAPFLGLSFFPL